MECPSSVVRIVIGINGSIALVVSHAVEIRVAGKYIDVGILDKIYGDGVLRDFVYGEVGLSIRIHIDRRHAPQVIFVYIHGI